MAEAGDVRERLRERLGHLHALCEPISELLLQMYSATVQGLLPAGTA